MCMVSVVNLVPNTLHGPKVHTMVRFCRDTVYHVKKFIIGRDLLHSYRKSEGLVRLPQRIMLYFGGLRPKLGIYCDQSHDL